MSDFLDAIGKFLGSMEPYPTCPECGDDNVVMDDNGDYEFYFCTNTDGECEWESKPREYGCVIHNEDEE
jgi:hypothetical protein